jgi:DNA-binding NtrC family response regulator
MPSEHPVILLVGSDPDVLILRAAVLASAGIWSLRVRNVDQAIEVLGTVPFDLVVICYMLDKQSQQQLMSFLLSAQAGIKVLWMVPGDDCSGTGFLVKVDDALDERPPAPSYMGNFQFASSLA